MRKFVTREKALEECRRVGHFPGDLVHFTLDNHKYRMLSGDAEIVGRPIYLVLAVSPGKYSGQAAGSGMDIYIPVTAVVSLTSPVKYISDHSDLFFKTKIEKDAE